MKTIEKVILLNYKRFPSFEITFDPKLNILVGDNEADIRGQVIVIVLLRYNNKYVILILITIYRIYGTLAEGVFLDVLSKCTS